MGLSAFIEMEKAGAKQMEEDAPGEGAKPGMIANAARAGNDATGESVNNATN